MLSSFSKLSLFSMLSSFYQLLSEWIMHLLLIRQDYNDFPFNLYLGIINSKSDLFGGFMRHYKEQDISKDLLVYKYASM